MARVRTAIIPAAGLGTRLLPAVKAVPKELLPVFDRPLLDHAIAEARAAGVERIVVVGARGKTALADHLDSKPELERALEAAGKTERLAAVRESAGHPGEIALVRQREPRGLGHAVWCAGGFVEDEAIAVLLPDDLIRGERGCLAELAAAHAEVGGTVLAVEHVARERTDRYGILDVEADDGRLARAQGVVEKPAPGDAPSQLAVVGRYILDPAVMTALDDQAPDAGGEVQLTDAIARTRPIHGVRFAGERFDCGTPAGLLEAGLARAAEDPAVARRLRPLADRVVNAADAAGD